MSEMVERVADNLQAITRQTLRLGSIAIAPLGRPIALVLAEAAIRAMLEPTELMTEAGIAQLAECEGAACSAEHAWGTMAQKALE